MDSKCLKRRGEHALEAAYTGAIGIGNSPPAEATSKMTPARRIALTMGICRKSCSKAISSHIPGHSQTKKILLEAV